MQTSVIAHRGASADRPENTLTAFELAYSYGAHGIETDVHLTKDRIPVLIHDPTVDRVTQSTGYIKDFTYNELKTLDIGSWYDPEYTDQRLLTLDQFLSWIHDKPLTIHLELKTAKFNYPEIEKIVIEKLKSFNLENRTTISSFNAHSLVTVKQLNPFIKTALLTNHYSQSVHKRVKEYKVDGVHLKFRALTPSVVKTIQKEHYIGVFTVNDSKKINQCYKLNCDIIMTDNVPLALQLREEYEHEQ
ncbi:glycerophosphoryl diester phosphodiesterase [Pelagirhabdus alkalitolerans]|uniref:Glycerophosphoryl diester phosphodiesterase n=1 Tax=Pelagirhabdus alkalitolerans TaxID=1612202 RepID=A0A1G6HC05_9BACI|nr:glycerophosphodiester phosphodiesterase family protein [Pelagirhabdus alkalitolerans]SDB91837.1 glycerophosphoryl diester phosphodiesterase [Pelagirhabdus alkalitolerans]